MPRLCILSFVCFAFVFLPARLSAQGKTNVVFILADDLGYGDLGAYGQKLIKTPNLDALAAGGMRFTQFYAGTSVCAPSRVSLMTGLHTGHTPVRGNYEIEPEGQLPIPAASFTLPELFKKAGYTTGAFGKWGLGFPGSEGAPEHQGVDEFYGYNCQRQSHNFFPDHLWENGKKVPLQNTITQQREYAPELIQKRALAFMQANRAQPFFLYLAYTLPHAGLQLPAGDPLFEHYKQQFNEEARPVPGNWTGKGYQPQAYPKAAYAAMVGKLDQYVGQVVKELERLGIAKQTLIVFTSDNGPHREGGNQPEFFKSSAGFKGIKRSLNEGGIREPMIAYWPGIIKAGRSSAHVGAFWDLMPTFAALTGQRLPVATDGISILPTLNGQGDQQRQHHSLYWEFHEDGGRQAVRLGQWKGIREQVIKNKDGAIALYNLETDPGETTDLSAKHPNIVREIRAIMKQSHVPNRHFPFITNEVKMVKH